MQLFLIISILIYTLCGNALCVSQDRTFFYEGPTSRSRKSFVAPLYFPVLEKEKKGAWTKIEDQDGEDHWVERKFLRGDWECLVVKSTRAALRVSPSKQAALSPFGYTDRYSAFQKLERESAWLKVQDDHGFIYWLHEDDVWEPLKMRRFDF